VVQIKKTLPLATVSLRPHSIILTSCKPGFRPGWQSGFRQVRAGLRHASDQLSTFFVENLVANRSRFAGSRACYRHMECRKSKFAAGFRHAFDLLATRFSTRFAAARITECGLYSFRDNVLLTKSLRTEMTAQGHRRSSSMLPVERSLSSCH